MLVHEWFHGEASHHDDDYFKSEYQMRIRRVKPYEN